MTESALFPFSSSAIRLIGQAMTSNNLWLLQQSTIVFVCGARRDALVSGRRDFLKYGERHFPWCRFFEAELAFDAIRHVQGRERVDLLTLEGYLADSADAILIIVESDGAKAELGAFAHDDKIAPITLAINDCRFLDSESFIAEGPIRKLNRVSKFKPMVHTRLDAITKGLDEVSERLERIRRKNRKRLSFDNAAEFLDLPRQHRVLLLADLIWLAAPISYEELISLLKAVLGNGDFGTLRYEVALLQALELIHVQQLAEVEYFLPHPSAWEPFCEYQGAGMLAMRSAFLAGYRRRHRTRLGLLEDRAQEVLQ
jgi:hypothetical protein